MAGKTMELREVRARERQQFHQPEPVSNHPAHQVFKASDLGPEWERHIPSVTGGKGVLDEGVFLMTLAKRANTHNCCPNAAAPASRPLEVRGVRFTGRRNHSYLDPEITEIFASKAFAPHVAARSALTAAIDGRPTNSKPTA